jgi:uncharacterized protein (DUF2141 family)
MNFFKIFSLVARAKKHPGRTQQRVIPRIEAFEDRLVLSTISGFVYNDANNNGIMDANEKGIPQNTIELLDASNQLVATTSTDPNGYYHFDFDPRISQNPTTATHTATFPNTATDWTSSQTIPQFDPSLGTLTSIDILNSDQITSTIKVENIDGAPATITATVSGTMTLSGPGVSSLVNNLSADQTFNASAFDGTIDFGGTSGHDFGPKTATGSDSVTLTSASDLAAYIGTGTVSFTEISHGTSTGSGAANLLLSINTTASGNLTVVYHYIPSNKLHPGNYTIVQVNDPPGYLDGQTTRGNITPIPNSVGTNSIPATLGGTDLTNNDFAEIKPSSLAGHVYYDVNDNGTLDTTEPGIAGTVITLTGTDDTGASVNLNTTTATDGTYSFDNLRPGTYTISETQPAGWLPGQNTVGTQGGVAGANQVNNIQLSPGLDGTNNNFGELKPASLSGYVYYDANDDGIRQGASDVGLGWVKVTLTGTDDHGQAVTQVQYTGALDGFYQFTNLRPGTYTISEGGAPGFLDGKETIGTPGGTTGKDQFSNIVLASGVTGTNNNFGEVLPGSLSGYVYYDANGSGIRQGTADVGLGFVPVTLTGTDDQGQAVSQVQLSAGADGSYSFKNLRPGTYVIAVGSLNGYIDGATTAGSQGGTVGNDQISGIQLQSNVNGVNNNFAKLGYGSLSGYVYFDPDNDGIKQGSDPGLGGVVVTLIGTDDLGNNINVVQRTNTDGSYTFGHLRKGTYTITETPPAGFEDGKDTIGSQGGTTGIDQFSNIVLGPNINGINNDFAETLPASHQVPPPPPPPPPPPSNYSKLMLMYDYVPGVGLVPLWQQVP